MIVDDRIADLVRRTTARTLVHDVATILSREGIPVMPLKGALLAETVYRSGPFRAFTDVDLLVPEEDFERAVEALERGAFVVAERALSADASSVLVPPGLGVTIDLHRRLFGRGLFALPTWALFARGTRDRSLFGVEVIVPDPRDQLAHAIGHYVKSRPTPAAETLALDLSLVAETHGVRPDVLARHLVSHGLGRAARLALPIAAEARPDRGAFARAVLGGLPPDPVGDRLARLVRDRLLEGDPGSLKSLVGQHALDRTLPHALVSAALHAEDTLRRRWV
ncbi:MAG: nucleotidyltransferase family protein [Polyangiales bacterium]